LAWEELKHGIWGEGQDQCSLKRALRKHRRGGRRRGFARRKGCSLHLVRPRSDDRLSPIRQTCEKSNGVRVVIHPRSTFTAPIEIAPLVDRSAIFDVLVKTPAVIPSGSLWDVRRAKMACPLELKVFGYINLTRSGLSEN